MSQTAANSKQNAAGSQQVTLWIDAYKSVTNQLNTYPNNIEMIDIDQVGENKLVVGEFSGQLTVYKNTHVDWQTHFADEISSVSQFNVSFSKGSRPDYLG